MEWNFLWMHYEEFFFSFLFFKSLYSTFTQAKYFGVHGPTGAMDQKDVVTLIFTSNIAL